MNLAWQSQFFFKMFDWRLENSLLRRLARRNECVEKCTLKCHCLLAAACLQWAIHQVTTDKNCSVLTHMSNFRKNLIQNTRKKSQRICCLYLPFPRQSAPSDSRVSQISLSPCLCKPRPKNSLEDGLLEAMINSRGRIRQEVQRNKCFWLGFYESISSFVWFFFICS